MWVCYWDTDMVYWPEDSLGCNGIWSPLMMGHFPNFAWMLCNTLYIPQELPKCALFSACGKGNPFVGFQETGAILPLQTAELTIRKLQCRLSCVFSLVEELHAFHTEYLPRKRPFSPPRITVIHWNTCKLPYLLTAGFSFLMHLSIVASLSAKPSCSPSSCDIMTTWQSFWYYLKLCFSLPMPFYSDFPSPLHIQLSFGRRLEWTVSSTASIWSRKFEFIFIVSPALYTADKNIV